MAVVVDFFLKQLDNLSKAFFICNISDIYLVMTDKSFSENLTFFTKNLCVKSSTRTYYRCLFRI